MSDEDYNPSQGKANNGGKKKGRKRKNATSSEEEEEEEDDDDLLGESDSELHWSTPSATDVESDEDDTEYEPKGRNAKRAAALKGTLMANAGYLQGLKKS